MHVTCDNTAQTLTFTCDALWVDVDDEVADGCEASYGQAVANLAFPPQRDFTVPANCAGSPSVGCVGGVPVDPPATIHVAASSVVATEVVGQSRFDVTAALGITGSVPVTIPLVGDCTLTINTSAGSSSAAHVSVPVNFVPNAATSGGYDITIGDVSITGVDSDDFNLGPSFACQIADLGISFFTDLLIDTLTDVVRGQVTGLCVAPKPQLIEVCPA
jgi:hypothetical protein